MNNKKSSKRIELSTVKMGTTHELSYDSYIK